MRTCWMKRPILAINQRGRNDFASLEVKRIDVMMASCIKRMGDNIYPKRGEWWVRLQVLEILVLWSVWFEASGGGGLPRLRLLPSTMIISTRVVSRTICGFPVADSVNGSLKFRLPREHISRFRSFIPVRMYVETHHFPCCRAADTHTWIEAKAVVVLRRLPPLVEDCRVPSCGGFTSGLPRSILNVRDSSRRS